MTGIPTGIDELAEALSHELEQEQALTAARSAQADLLRLLESVERPPVDAGTQLAESQPISDFLLKCHAVLEEALRRQVSGYSRYRWLWYLRRTPDRYFEGRHTTTLGYDRTLAEALAAHSLGESRHRVTNGMLVFSVDRAAARHVHRLIAGIKLLSHIHVLLRFAGKGAAFRFSRGPIPDYVVSEAMLKAIDIYDQRLAEHQNLILSGLGTTIDLAAIAKDEKQKRGSLLLLLRCQPVVRSVPLFDRAAVSQIKVLTNFVPLALHLSDLVAWLADKRASGIIVPSSLGPQLLLLQICLRVAIHFRGSFLGMMRYGYFPIPSRDAEHVINLWIPDAAAEISSVLDEVPLPNSYAALRDALKSSAPELWPKAPGSPLFIEDDVTCLDVVGACDGLFGSFARLRSAGPAANARADSFERETQAHIDKSNWTPAANWRDYAGRTLRVGGRAITNIDAVGCRGKTLLLVSCKSVVYSHEYDMGDYRTIRNVATVINSAVKDWSGIVHFVRENRRGDNYDFSDFDEILGVVCTPFHVFTDDELALQEVDVGLRAAGSLEELTRWMAR